MTTRFRASPSLEAVSRWVAILVVVLAPVPYGSIEPAWAALWAALMGGSLLLADTRRPSRFVRRLLLLIGALSAAWLVVLLIQGSAHPVFGADPVWAREAALVAHGMTPRISASAQSPFLALAPALLMTLTFVRFVLIGQDADRAEQVLRWVRTAGLVIGLASFTLFALDPNSLLGRTKVYYLGNFTGTFVNRNTAATFFGTSTLLWACHVRAILPTDLFRRTGSFVGTALRLSDHLTGPWLPSAMAMAVCFGWTAMTASRAGILLTTALLLLVFAVGTRSAGRGRSGRTMAIAVAGTLLVVLVLTGGLVGARIASSGFADIYRLEAYRISLGLIRAHPWLGSGLGNFETVFPAARTPEMSMRGVWEFAHSTPLELALDVGLPLAGATLAVWGFAGLALMTSCRRAGSIKVRAPAMAVGLLGVAHSLIDFPLQIPGYAIVFAAITACGLAQVVQSPGADETHPVEYELARAESTVHKLTERSYVAKPPEYSVHCLWLY